MLCLEVCSAVQGGNSPGVGNKMWKEATLAVSFRMNGHLEMLPMNDILHQWHQSMFTMQEPCFPLLTWDHIYWTEFILESWKMLCLAQAIYLSASVSLMVRCRVDIGPMTHYLLTDTRGAGDCFGKHIWKSWAVSPEDGSCTAPAWGPDKQPESGHPLAPPFLFPIQCIFLYSCLLMLLVRDCLPSRNCRMVNGSLWRRLD